MKGRQAILDITTHLELGHPQPTLKMLTPQLATFHPLDKDTPHLSKGMAHLGRGMAHLGKGMAHLVRGMGHLDRGTVILSKDMLRLGKDSSITIPMLL